MGEAERQAIVDQMRWMHDSGLNRGTSGNISVRHGSAMLITPSATPPDAMTPGMIAEMPVADEDGVWQGPSRPSSEWRFHQAIMRCCADVGAVVHTHSTFATILAIAGKPIPACHYMIAAFGGTDVRVAPYATFGTPELSRAVLSALQDRHACLMANHGALATGRTLDEAMWRAVELEAIAKQYYHSLLIGGPILLSDAQIAQTMASFGTYGRQDRGA